MLYQVCTSPLAGLPEPDRIGMLRLRYDTFKVRLGWDVHTTDDGLEVDQYDADRRSVYIIAKSDLESVDACWRLLPTTGRYMLSDCFRELLHGEAAPHALDVWELSRFAIATDRLSGLDNIGNHQIGFGQLSIQLMIAAAKFALANGISRYVTVTTTSIERMLKRQGLHIHRLGPPIRVGHVMTIACFIEVDDVTLGAIHLSE